MSVRFPKFLLPPFLIKVGIVFLVALTAIVVNYKTIHNGIIFESYDIKYHLIWLQHFSKQITEGILYPRWLAGDNYGYGSPTFVFYPPLVYYLGSFLKISGLDIEKTIIALFYLAIFASGLSFYFYGRSHWGKIAALSGALFYMTAPYIGFNLYLRGALAETWSLVWIPLFILCAERAIVQPRWRVALTIIITIVALTHVPSLLICTLFLLPYLICFLGKHPWKAILSAIASFFLGFGIASFFILPAILEKSLVNINIMRSDDVYKLNLLGFGLTETTNIVRKYVQPIFLYNCSIVLIISLAFLYFYFREKTLQSQAKKWLLILTTLAFLTIYPSLFIWETSQTLQMIQFPWRLLGLFSFGVAVLFATAVEKIVMVRGYSKMFLLAIAVILLLENTLYIYKLSLALPGFQNPGNMELAKEKGSWKASIYEQVKVVLYDPYSNKVRGTQEYRPLLKNGRAAPAPLLEQPAISVLKGKAETAIALWKSERRKFQANVKETSTIRVRTYYYPAWHLLINNMPHPLDLADDGTIIFELPAGRYIVELNYQWTPAFLGGTILSFLSIMLVILFCFSNSLAFNLNFFRNYNSYKI
jgi:uncharacterized membrane protein